MSLHARHKPKLVARLRRIEGQVRALAKLIDEVIEVVDRFIK
jgi:DNA-binding FrmR family transcriptional regulator